jgi:hypothetical protein
MTFAPIPGTIEADAFEESEEGDFLGKASARVLFAHRRKPGGDGQTGTLFKRLQNPEGCTVACP